MAIAIHFFCPQHQREHRFLQYYLGHVIEGEITPNSRATDHYFQYVLTRNSKPLNASGLKVAAHELVPVQGQETETVGGRSPRIAACFHRNGLKMMETMTAHPETHHRLNN